MAKKQKRKKVVKKFHRRSFKSDKGVFRKAVSKNITTKEKQGHKIKAVHIRKPYKNDVSNKKRKRTHGARSVDKVLFSKTLLSKRKTRTFVKIKVVGIGGGGGNAITRIKKDFSIRGVEFIAINTDIQDLESCDANKKLNIGRSATKGMGAGMNPEIGQQAAEESRADIAEALMDTDMVFLTAGFGGGTGTGAAPVVADITRELGILTVAIITKPFSFEGLARMKIAEEGMVRIKDKVDTLLTIPNDRIFGIIDKNTSVLKAFEKIDEILKSAVQSVSEVVTASGLVNVDFADIQAVMSGAGIAVIGVGTSSGADRAVRAVNQAVNSPLLDISIDGARNVLFCVSGRHDLKMAEINEAAKLITENVDPGAKIIFGAYNDRKLKVGQIKIILIAAGFNGMILRRDTNSLSLFSGGVNSTESSLGDEFLDEKSALEEDNGDKNSRFSGKTAGKGGENNEDVWDIPTFLRKRGRRRQDS
jgi:cell division protein FtsZ